MKKGHVILVKHKRERQDCRKVASFPKLFLLRTFLDFELIVTIFSRYITGSTQSCLVLRELTKGWKNQIVSCCHSLHDNLQEKPLPTCHAEVLHNTSVKLVPWHLYLRTRKIKRAKGARSTRVGGGGGRSEQEEQEELPIPPLGEVFDSIRAFKDQINTKKHRAVNSLDGICLVKYNETNWLKELTKYESVSSLHFTGRALCLGLNQFQTHYRLHHPVAVRQSQY